MLLLPAVGLPGRYLLSRSTGKQYHPKVEDLWHRLVKKRKAANMQ
jgi:hypothetical protein